MNERKSIVSFLLCGFLGMTGALATLPVNFPLAFAQTNPTQTDETHNAIAERLYGFWKYVYPEDGTIVYIQFKSDGTLAIVEPNRYVDLLQYQINTQTQPMQLDLLDEAGLTLTIFEFTPSGQLLVELENADWSTFRPSEFSSETRAWEKIPGNAPIIPQLQEQIEIATAQKKVEESERFARSDLGAMSRAQQAYRLEFPYFADTLVELGVGIPSETEEYQYHVIRQGDRKTAVMMTATAKQPHLLSFSSFVHLNHDGISQVLICITDEPSTVAPEIIVDWTNSSEPVRCGVGSHSL